MRASACGWDSVQITRVEALTLELIESAVVNYLDRADMVFKGLRDRRVGLCIDDFGTGYSSLSQLRRLRFDSLKIDCSFVRDLPHEEAHSMVSAMVNMAHCLKMTVVAEGIETPEQRDLLTKMGCDFGQGYLFARPQPHDGIAALYRRSQA